MAELKEKLNIAVIGGGASGMTAAIFASKNKNVNVTIFERNESLGKKLLSTGNGHANISNEDLKYINKDNVDYYFHCDDEDDLLSILNSFSFEQLMDFFKSIGIYVMNKNGYIYPYSNQASAVLNAFANEIEKIENIEVCLNTKINNIKKANDGYELFYKKGEHKYFDKVIMCSGGCAFPKSGSDGTSFYLLDLLNINYNKMLPALCECKTAEFSEAAGCRSNVSLCLRDDKKEVSNTYIGELQINKDGLSGIVVFQISAIASKRLAEGKKTYVCIDFLKDFDKDKLITDCRNYVLKNPKERFSSFFNTLISDKLIKQIFDKASIDYNIENSSITDDEIDKMLTEAKNCNILIDSVAGFDKAQTGTGGVALSAVSANMEMQDFTNLFLCGEILDVDGICGGYNLSFAFITGALAGMEASKC